MFSKVCFCECDNSKTSNPVKIYEFKWVREVKIVLMAVSLKFQEKNVRT